MNYLPVDSITRRNSSCRRNSGCSGRKLSSKEDLEDELFGGPQVSDDEIAALLLESENPKLYKEELRKKNQLKLESRLHIQTAQRLGVYDTCPSLWVSKTTSASDDEYEYEYQFDDPYVSESEDDYVTTPVIPKNTLQLTRNNLWLYNVTIHPCLARGRQGKTVTGTLETHANGFRYRNYVIPFELDIMFHNVRYAFFQDGDKERAPLCHLHLHNPIMVGSEMTKDIQFRMVCRNMRRLVRDSDEFKKENQKAKANSEVIRDFLSRVNPICLRSCLFQFKEVKKKRGFYGELTLKEEQLSLEGIFVFTFTCLVQLENMPFTVVILSEIEIVNLVHAGSGKEIFNMTIVFKDFKRDVLQISSIPLTKLISIKESLDIGEVKYYESQCGENELDISLWRCVLQKITENPQTFIENGGWNILNSGNLINLAKLFQQQDPSGITCYSDIEPGQASDTRKKKMPVSVAKRTMPVGKRVMTSSDESECDSVPEVNEKEIKHTAQRKLVKTARRRMVISDESDGEE